MKALSPRDAAILALVVENPRMNEARYESLQKHVQDHELRELLVVCRAVQKGEILNGQANRFAPELQAIKAWGEANTGRRVQHPEPECDLAH